MVQPGTLSQPKSRLCHCQGAQTTSRNQPGRVVYACNPSTWEVEAGGLLSSWPALARPSIIKIKQNTNRHLRTSRTGALLVS